MKYISTILFALCLGWTWKVIHTQGTVSFNTHAALQNKLAEIIANTLKTLKPESANFKIEYLWTEVLPNGQIKANFSYKFDEVDSEEDIVESSLEGYSILEKEKSVAEQEDRWTVIEVKTNSSTLNFHEGIVITPSKTEDSTATPEQSTPPPAINPQETNIPTQNSSANSNNLSQEKNTTTAAPLSTSLASPLPSPKPKPAEHKPIRSNQPTPTESGTPSSETKTEPQTTIIPEPSSSPAAVGE